VAAGQLLQELRTLKITPGSSNVFRDIGFSEEEAEDLYQRAIAMFALADWFKSSRWSRKRAATLLGIPQTRLTDLLKNRIGRFSLNDLKTMWLRVEIGKGMADIEAGRYGPIDFDSFVTECREQHQAQQTQSPDNLKQDV
jgi:predicted XRE-type DNA-binding protein